MKKAFAAILALAAFAAFAAPQFITHQMRLRNGLTDAQYERLWSLGFNPSVDIATQRDWVYRASRYENVTNWLAIVGATNNFAALASRLQARAETLETEAAAATSERNYYRAGWNTATNQLAAAYKLLDENAVQFSALSNRVNAAERRAERLDALKAYLEEQRDKALLHTTKEIYQNLIDLIDQKTDR